jgi:hypothetical protein
MSKLTSVVVALALASTIDSARAQAVAFPPFVRGTENGSQLIIPSCVVDGARMNCELMVFSVFPWSAGGSGNCQVHLLAQSLVFRREDANTWVGDYTVAYCRIKNTYRLVQSVGPPRRVALRLTYELGEKSEGCLKAEREFREKEWKEGMAALEWTEAGPDKLIPFVMPACKSFTTGPGQFPAAAFPR